MLGHNQTTDKADPSQYGHSQSEKKWGLRDKYQRSIKVHTKEAQNQNKLKSHLSDVFMKKTFFLLYNM